MRNAKHGANVEAAKQTVLQLLDLLDAGEVTADELRERARQSPLVESLLPWIDLAELLHQAPKQNETPVPVKNPGFRRGTGMQPTAWADCLWRPPRS